MEPYNAKHSFVRIQKSLIVYGFALIGVGALLFFFANSGEMLVYGAGTTGLGAGIGSTAAATLYMNKKLAVIL